MRGSLSQFGPSCAVSLKITELITPHSGLNMKRIEKMVGIEGTAQGMMKITESQRIQMRSCTKNPESHSASRNFRLTATSKEDYCVDDRADEDRVGEQPRIARRVAREPTGP